MRDILFRGKREDNGEWVYGYYVKLPDAAGSVCFMHVPAGNPDECNTAHYVALETVGQYTGLTDKNGNKIFEGDIVRWKECDRWAPDDGIVSGYVLYADGQWFIQRPNIRSYLWLEHSLCEIIGNIHDNPELMGGESDA